MKSLERLTVYQLKDIIRQYAETHPIFKIKYKSKNKTELIKIIKDNKINKNKYDIPYFNPKTSP
jgi:hypothetical protein